ncbi:MAG TPA: DUF4386 domain-containing protein [Bryobacteraceae bacterium]|nr:DUF4386 domain-containing protein [Bryobacteraceae bacterium]
MSSRHDPGRVAGCLYLLTGFSIIRPMYIGRTLIVRDHAVSTIRNIAEHERLFRFGMVCDLIAGLACLFAALALYRLLRRVDPTLAILLVILGGLMPCVLDFLNVLNDAAVVVVARGEPFVSLFDKPQQAALAALFLRVHDHGFLLAEVFAGLWLFPFGLLVVRSGFLPRILGLLLFVSGVGYLAISGAGLLFPLEVEQVSRIASPALLGEGGIVFWLLIKGARPPEAPDEPGGR